MLEAYNDVFADIVCEKSLSCHHFSVILCFRYVADFFVQMRETGTYNASPCAMAHAQEVFGMLSAVSDDERFEDYFNSNLDSGGKTKNMCEFIDDTLAKGRAEGIQQEALRSRQNTAKRLLDMGMDYAFIAKALDIKEEEVPQLVQ